MQIEKINENQIEVILNLDDLNKNNISIHSFMCNSSESQKLFLKILSFANDEIGFDLTNYEITIEAFSVPSQNSFVLVITRLPKVIYLRRSNLNNNKFKFNTSFWIKFDKFEQFCMFCNSLQNNIQQHSTLYLLDSCYFLHIKFNKLKDYLRISTIVNEFSNQVYSDYFNLDENAEIIIKKCAIEMCRKFFV